LTTSPADAEGSLRSRLLHRLLLPLMLALVVDAVLGHFLLLHPLNQAYDTALADSAAALARHVRPQENSPGTSAFDLSAEGEEMLRSDHIDEVHFLVLGPGDSFIAGDPLLPKPPRRESGTNFYNGDFGGKPVRAVAFITRSGANEVTVIVAETTRKRIEAIWEVALGVGLPQVVLALVVLVVVWFGLRSGMASLDRLRLQLQGRAAGDMGPLDPSGVVTELHPLVEAFDGLLTRLDAASSAQVRFLANAAHQLRTPLAGLQAQLELAIEDDDPDARKARLLNCREATLRTARLVNQLLALSAAEPDGRQAAAWQDGDLKDILSQRAQEWVERAILRNIDLGLELEPAPFRGDGLLIGEMAANLVDNAFVYGRPAGQVTVRCGQCDGQTFLEVEDDGPGIPEAQRKLAVDRFYRAAGTQGVGIGSGLGLSIVDEIARNHGGRLLLEGGSQGGLRARVLLPASKSS
jgi:two-component system sensor histidine kinase TctE